MSQGLKQYVNEISGNRWREGRNDQMEEIKQVGESTYLFNTRGEG